MTSLIWLEKDFKVKAEGKPNDFLGCDALREEGKDKCCILQPHLMKKLEQNFGELVKKKQVTNTLGTPRLVQTVARNEEEKLGKEVHRKFRSGVGSLLHLLKHLRESCPIQSEN